VTSEYTATALKCIACERVRGITVGTSILSLEELSEEHNCPKQARLPLEISSY